MRAKVATAAVIVLVAAGCSVPDYEIVDQNGEDSSTTDVVDGSGETHVDSAIDSAHDGDAIVVDSHADADAADSHVDSHADADADVVVETGADADAETEGDTGTDTGVDSGVDTAPDTFDAGCTEATCGAGTACCGGSCIDVTGDVTNCGGCGVLCPATLGTPTCIGGVCSYSSCASGLADCDGSGRCLTAIHDDVKNCGGCGVTCSVSNGVPGCTGTTCTLVGCFGGFADCDSSYATGCETPTTTLTDCGGCGVACATPHATPTCATGACAVSSCDAGFGNCNGSVGDGCETDLTTTSDCVTCGAACTAPPHASAACTASGCGMGACSAGFANCNGSTGDGCERSMSTVVNSCATATALTAPGGVTPICAYGATQSTTSVTNFGDAFYSVGVHKCGGGCNAGNPERAKIVVTSPPGMAFDLFVYSDSACSTLVGSSTSGVLGGTETVNWIDGTCPTGTRTLRIEVKWRAGDGCGSATLNVTGFYTPYP